MNRVLLEDPQQPFGHALASIAYPRSPLRIMQLSDSPTRSGLSGEYPK
jgi:hypothetical protein